VLGPAQDGTREEGAPVNHQVEEERVAAAGVRVVDVARHLILPALHHRRSDWSEALRLTDDEDKESQRVNETLVCSALVVCEGLEVPLCLLLADLQVEQPASALIEHVGVASAEGERRRGRHPVLVSLNAKSEQTAVLVGEAEDVKVVRSHEEVNAVAAVAGHGDVEQSRRRDAELLPPEDRMPADQPRRRGVHVEVEIGKKRRVAFHGAGREVERLLSSTTVALCARATKQIN